MVGHIRSAFSSPFGHLVFGSESSGHGRSIDWPCHHLFGGWLRAIRLWLKILQAQEGGLGGYSLPAADYDYSRPKVISLSIRRSLPPTILNGKPSSSTSCSFFTK